MQQVRAARFQCRRQFSRSSAYSWRQAVRFWLVFIACLAQIGMPAQHWLAPGFAAHSMVSDPVATGSGFTPARFDAGQSGVPCPLHGTHATSHDGNGPAPCHHEDCPFCPCLCCVHVHAAVGILLQETARTDYAPPFSRLAPPPVRLGSSARFACIAGQPRAPPILI